MAYEKLCMYCFEELGGRTTCPHCGRDNQAAVPQIQMLPGTLVYRDRFVVGRALGQDATGIVYAAYDTKKGNKLRIREYLPRGCAERLNDGTVVPIAGMEDQYDAGIRKLKASVQDGEEARRHFFFEQNGTAYIVQRPSAAASAGEDSGRRQRSEDPEEEGGGRRGLILGLVAAVVVIGAAAALFLMFKGPFSGTKDITETPTMDPEQLFIPSESPTVTPYASPTFAALVDPELSWMEYDYDYETGGDASGGAPTQAARTASPTATPRPTAKPTISGDASQYTTVSERSSSAEIRQFQQKLVELGWLSSKRISGKYDSHTLQAVRDFQTFINENYSPVTALKVDGIAGPKTLQWLYQTNASRPAATPTPSPTPTARPTRRPHVTAPPDDDTAVDEHSSSRRIRSMQRELIQLGVLPEGSDNGKYDATTRSAVRRFQNRVNDLQGYEVLEVTGRMDALSMAFLDYYADEWRVIQTATATPEPRVTPTPTPTSTAGFDGSTVTEHSSAEAIREVQRRLIAIGMLPEGTADGVYGEATRRAVASFQQWVNQRRGEATLPTNGEADALTVAYIKYCQDKGLKPGAEATQAPTTEPEEEGEDQPITIDAGSDKASIRRVQQMLAEIGLLDPRGVDGIYGSSTSAAVAAFQRYVNAHGGSLSVTGVVDDNTRLSLEYYFDSGLAAVDETPVPETPVPETPVPETPVPETPVPETPVPETPVPETPVPETPTPVPEAPGTEEPYEGESYMERPPYEDPAYEDPDYGDPVYEEPTPGPVPPEAVDPEAGESEEEPAGELPSPSPTVDPSLVPSVSPEPGADGAGALDTTAQTGTITGVQELLIAVGALPDGGVTGEYDGDTRQAVVNFQHWVTASGLMTLEETGAMDGDTRRMLAYCADNAMRIGDAIPASDPDDPFNEPDDDETTGGDDRRSVGPVSITIDGHRAGDDVIVVSGKSFTVKWSAKGRVSNYNVYIVDGRGEVMNAAEGTRKTSFKVNVRQMTPGEIYTVTVGAVPRRGGEEDVAYQSARFTRPAEATPVPTDTPAPTDTPEPTAEPTEVPTPSPEPTATPEPTVGAVEVPRIEISGGEVRDGVTVIYDDSFRIAWRAEGGVQSYDVQLVDDGGRNISSWYGIQETEIPIRTASMEPEVVYTIAVGATPVNGGGDDTVWSRAKFMRPAPVTPEPSPTPTPEPTAEPTPTPTPEPTVAPVSRPAVTVGGAGYQQGGMQYMTDNTIIVSWGAEGEVAGYIIYVENAAGERNSLGATTDTSRTVAAASLPSGIYTVYVGAVPVNGTEDDAQWGAATFGIPAATTPEPEPEATPEPEPESEAPAAGGNYYDAPISADSDPAAIQRLQMRLYGLGVMTGEPEQGALDRVTLQAVAEFQSKANAQYNAGLTPIDPNDPNAVIDVQTLQWIMRGL